MLKNVQAMRPWTFAGAMASRMEAKVDTALSGIQMALGVTLTKEYAQMQ